VSSSKPIVAVIDYDRGNLHSVVRAFEAAGATVHLAKTADELKRASHVVLPGVGAYKDCMETFVATGLQDPVAAFIASGKPFLGICLGMQLLLERSFEFGVTQGLGILPGEVLPFPVNELPDESTLLKIPHMGWNSIHWQGKGHPLFAGIPSGTDFYFVHSFYCRPTDAADVIATCDYTGPYCAALARDNVMAVQFHPEKSQGAGQRLIHNFLGMGRG